MQTRRVTLIAATAALALLAAGCFGTSASPSTHAKLTATTHTALLPAGVDAPTVRRLMAEWHAARFSCMGIYGLCPRQRGPFAAGTFLVSAMRRINPTIPASSNLDATMGLKPVVIVRNDSSPGHLDLETWDTKGRVIRLVATDKSQPRLLLVQ